MRVIGQFVVLVCLLIGVVAAQSTDRAAQILAEARTAMGGAKLEAVKTLVANGRTKRVRGNNLQPIEFEISIELPDKYLRKDEFPAEEADPTSTGFSGDTLLQFPMPAVPTMPPAMAGRAGAPPLPSPEQLETQRLARVTTAKQEFSRLALGLFAGSVLSNYPLTFTFAGQAEAPQGKADVLDVAGASNFKLRLYINSQTHLPIMVGWQLPPTNVVVLAPGQPAPATVAPGAVVVTGPAAPGASATDDEKKKYTADVAELRKKTMAVPVEHRLYFADYRDVDGVMLPFRLRRAIGVDTSEETTFDRFRINARIDPKKFTSGK